MVFIAIVDAVVLVLSLSSHKRTTTAVPNDAVHIQSTSRQACMGCHGPEGTRPRPREHHTAGDQCFQCHQQPRNWQGEKQ